MFRYLTIVLLFLTTIATASQGEIPRPPFFSDDADPEEVLLDYPLNVMTEQLAFSYHGAPIEKFTLPNGHTGWVYEVGGTPTHRLYISPSGNENHLFEADRSAGLKTYILVFDEEMVVNVLYRDNDRDKALSALQLQHEAAAKK
jgi:hypothetical protein